LHKLFDFGYSPQVRTLFICERMAHYLTAEAVNQTLEFVRQHSGSGSSIIFDYVYTSALTATHKRGRSFACSGPGGTRGRRRFLGIEEAQVEAFLRARGYTQIQKVTSQDLERIWSTGVNQDRTIAPIHAIVHATVGV
jgi:methyltransferase (TIGR00027 family)